MSNTAEQASMCGLSLDNFNNSREPRDMQKGTANLFRKLSTSTASVVTMPLLIKAASWETVHHLIGPLAKLPQDGHLQAVGLLVEVMPRRNITRWHMFGRKVFTDAGCDCSRKPTCRLHYKHAKPLVNHLNHI